MRVSRAVPMLVLFVLLSGGQAYAAGADMQTQALPGDKVIAKACFKSVGATGGATAVAPVWWMPALTN